MSLTQDTLQKIAAGVATATLVALGGTTISTRVNDARQDTKIEQITESVASMKDLEKSLNETNKNVLILTAKMEAQEARYVSRD